MQLIEDAIMTSINVQSYQSVPTDWECSVCLDNEVEGMELRGHPSVVGEDHIYHKECLNEALRVKPDCPLCRAPLSSREVTVESSSPIGLEFNIDFPALLETPKQYMTKVAQHLPKTAAFTTALVTLGLISGQSSISPVNAFVGSLVGGSVSYAVRNLSHIPPIEQSLLEPDGLKEMVKSYPFIGALATTALLAPVAALGSILNYSTTALVLGVLCHSVAENAHKNGTISEEQKNRSQTITAVVTSALSLNKPISTLISLGVGAIMGATAEACYAQSNREVAQEA